MHVHRPASNADGTSPACRGLRRRRVRQRRRPNHAYASADDYTVTLTAKDNDGDETSVSKTVTVTAAVAGAPTANFTVSCNSLDCALNAAPTSPPQHRQLEWTFGDDATSTAQIRRCIDYDVNLLSTFTAKLEVTDDDGNTSTKTSEFTISPAATLQCESAPGTGDFASCDLVLPDAASVKSRLESASCDANSTRSQSPSRRRSSRSSPTAATPPRPGHVVPSTWNGGAKFTAGTRLKAQVIFGLDRRKWRHALHVEGSHPPGRSSSTTSEDEARRRSRTSTTW